jgi:acyl-CoA thioesterase-1
LVVYRLLIVRTLEPLMSGRLGWFVSRLLLFVGMWGVTLAWSADAARPSKYGSFQPLDPALQPALVEVPDVRGLPRVLLIGDSISIGYTLAVRKQLAGIANVHRPAENCGSTGYGLERLDAWLGSGPWAVIHFNFGLHDLKYLDAEGNYVSRDRGQQLVPLDEYEKFLREIVRRLQRTGARLIFATTTPIPAGTLGREEGSEVLYNATAIRVMREADVAINDLHAYAKTRQATIQLPRNVHFSPAGSDELATLVVRSIQTALTP